MAFSDRSDAISLPGEEVTRLGAEAQAVVRRGRAHVARRLGLEPDNVVYMRQVHGATVGYVGRPGAAPSSPMDGMCTDRPGLALAVLVADCAPVLLADPEAGVVGTAHAGRSGTSAGVVAALVESMAGRGADPSRTIGLVGPCICALCYEVSPETRSAMAASVPEAWATTRIGTAAIDLRSAITAQLRRLGVTQVRHDRRCTKETPELYSYRREGPTGDFAGFVWLKGA
ncbi:polyphenol oxidase family protein [Nonomuraea sp. NPDC050643]|uniref:polyphenol oxidase family protein n=1 Tax=Nonomuraea sp. NPDC050643 TaxID=3155660 RepID=UPI0034015271